MNTRSLNHLIAHSPWTDYDLAEQQDSAQRLARQSASAAKRKADTALFAGAVVAGYAILQALFKEQGSMVVPACLTAGALLVIVGMKLLFMRQTEVEALAAWRRDHGVSLLSLDATEALKKLAVHRPEALQRIHAWEALGLRLRHRDRDAIESYLRECGVEVPDREEASIADFITPADGLRHG